MFFYTEESRKLILKYLKLKHKHQTITIISYTTNLKMQQIFDKKLFICLQQNMKPYSDKEI